MRTCLLNLFIVLTISFFNQSAAAQTDSLSQKPDSLPLIKTLRVGIFAPLYLDSIFNAEEKFRYKQGLPKFVIPGIDFVNGAQIALDSINPNANYLNAFIYDTKSYKSPVEQLIRNKNLDSLDLIIGSVKDLEYKQLADFALMKNIPFISATYPNDGGVTANPYLVLVNSTLKAHCEAIYGFVLQNYGTDKVLLIRKKGTQEDKVASYFKNINEPDGKPLINIETMYVDSTFSSYTLQKKLDSNRQAIVIGASLDENFATRLTAACYDLHEQYSITLVGMPNWDGFKSLMKKDQFEGFPIFFTTPYFNSKLDEYSRILTNGYAKKYKGKPADMAFKGFESTYLFTRLLMAYPRDMMSHLNDKNFKVFSDYNFKPVSLKKDNTAPDYFENKHLYFIRIMNGATSRTW